MHLRNCKMFTLLVILASLLAFPQLLGLWGQDPDVFLCWDVNPHLWEVLEFHSASSTCFCIHITLISESRFKTTLQMFFVWVKHFGFPSTTPIISRVQSCFNLWFEVLHGVAVAGVAGSRHFSWKIFKDLTDMFHDLPTCNSPFALSYSCRTNDLHEMFICGFCTFLTRPPPQQVGDVHL